MKLDVTDSFIRLELIKIAAQRPNPIQGVVYLIYKAQELYEWVNDERIPEVQEISPDQSRHKKSSP